jgi:hypothetical protein
MSSGMNSQLHSSIGWLRVARGATARLLLALSLALTYCVLTDYRSSRRVSASTTSKIKQESFHVNEAPKGSRE